MNRRLLRGIYKRGNVYWFTIQKDKKRHVLSLKTDDLNVALLKAARLRHDPELESGEILEHAVERFIRYMRGSDRWTRATEDSKGYVLKCFAARIGQLRPVDVTTEDIRRYHAERAKKRSPSTAYGNLMTIRSFFNWCRDIEKTVRENPCELLRIRAPATIGRREFCTPQLVERLINECPREDLKFVLFCGFHAGLRAQEITEARPFWFDLKAHKLHLRKTETMRFKDQEERSIPLTGKFLAFLRDEYGLREPFMLHPEKEHGRNRYRYDFTRPFTEYMAHQGCEWITPHIMRHTFASLLASANHSIFKIATYLGDDVRVVQRHYAKLLPEVGALDSAFAHSPAPSKDRKASQAASKATRS